jgi:stress-induced-phosphoprotein 1
LEKDHDGKHAAEIHGQIQKAYFAMSQVNSGADAEANRQRAMADPEVQSILMDPVMQTILKQMQEDPSAIRDHMKNPIIAKKMQVLMNAGIVSMR